MGVGCDAASLSTRLGRTLKISPLRATNKCPVVVDYPYFTSFAKRLSLRRSSRFARFGACFILRSLSFSFVRLFILMPPRHPPGLQKI
jgi:hypothetical protein